jgi:hypothetical protein
MQHHFNMITILGTVVDDAEVSYTDRGTPMLMPVVQVTERVRDREFTDRFNLAFFGERAPGLAKGFRRGALVLVTGPLRHRQIRPHRVIFLDGRSAPAELNDIGDDAASVVDDGTALPEADHA